MVKRAEPQPLSPAAWALAAIVGSADLQCTPAEQARHDRGVATGWQKLINKNTSQSDLELKATTPQPKTQSTSATPTPAAAPVPLPHNDYDTLAWIRYEQYPDQSKLYHDFLIAYDAFCKEEGVLPYKKIRKKIGLNSEFYEPIADALAGLIHTYYENASFNKKGKLKVEDNNYRNARACKDSRIIGAAEAKATEARKYETWVKQYSPLVNTMLDTLVRLEQKGAAPKERNATIGDVLATAAIDPQYTASPTKQYEQRIILSKIFGDLMGKHQRYNLPAKLSTLF